MMTTAYVCLGIVIAAAIIGIAIFVIEFVSGTRHDLRYSIDKLWNLESRFHELEREFRELKNPA